MRINSVKTTTFQSRHPKIKEAEKVLRIFNANFPAVSLTKIDGFNNSDKINPDTMKFFFQMNVRIPFIKNWKNVSPLICYDNLIKSVKKYHFANCGEMAVITNLLLNINNIKSYYAKFSNTAMSHDAVIVPAKQFSAEYCSETPLRKLKDILVVDPWLGFVDFARNAEQKYKSVYRNFAFFKYADEESKDEDIYLTIMDKAPQVSDETFSGIKNVFKLVYPQFFIEKGKPLIRR